MRAPAERLGLRQLGGRVDAALIVREDRTIPMLRFLRVAGRVLLIALVVLVAFLVVAAVGFYTPKAAERPCQACSGDLAVMHVNGFDLYRRQIGVGTNNPPVVILHGGPGHSSDSYRRSLDFLADQYRLIYYDQRGSGHSEIKPDPSLYTIEQLVAELDAIRQEVIGADRIILIAHSAGGALAQRYALSHPDHVAKLVLISTIPINNGVSVPILWDAFGPAFFVFGLGFPPSDPLAANEWFTEASVESSVPRLYDPANRALLEDAGTVSFVTWREVSRSLEGDDYHEALARLPIPTLVTYGVADGSATGESVASRICAQISHCQLVGFKRSGHWAFLEEPERFADALSTFLLQP